LTLQCIRCNTKYPTYPLKGICDKCGGTIEYAADLPQKEEGQFSGPQTFWKYKALLPPVPARNHPRRRRDPLHKAEDSPKPSRLGQLISQGRNTQPNPLIQRPRSRITHIRRPRPWVRSASFALLTEHGRLISCLLPPKQPYLPHPGSQIVDLEN